MYMRTRWYKKEKGFTLVEMIIAVFIFLMVILALVTLFAAQMRAYMHARSGQKDLENAQFALNYLGKSLRTATLVGADGRSLQRMQIQQGLGNDFWNFHMSMDRPGKTLVFYDFSQDLCMRLFVKERADGLGSALFLQEAANKPQGSTGGLMIAYDRTDVCMDPRVYSDYFDYRETRLTSGDVDVNVWVVPTRSTDIFRGRQTNTIGRATITLKVWPLNHKDDDKPMYIQTTASLRDYPRDMSY